MKRKNKQPWSSSSERVRNVANELRREYPGGYYPMGALSLIANKYGLSRERVRQIASSMDMKVKFKKDIKRECLDCGKILTEKKVRLCLNCRSPKTRCDNCGKLYRVSKQHHKRWVEKKGRYQGLFQACSVSCRIEKMRKLGVAKRARRINNNKARNQMLKTFRTKHMITQGQIAEEIGCSLLTIHLWESEHPPVGISQRLAQSMRKFLSKFGYKLEDVGLEETKDQRWLKRYETQASERDEEMVCGTSG